MVDNLDLNALLLFYNSIYFLPEQFAADHLLKRTVITIAAYTVLPP
jgi:hypothetical protein